MAQNLALRDALRNETAHGVCPQIDAAHRLHMPMASLSCLVAAKCHKSNKNPSKESRRNFAL